MIVNLFKMLGLAFLLTLIVPIMATAADGKEIFEANNCASCHYTEGPAREKTIADQLAKKGPELWYAGSKFQSAWLEEWLQKPTVIRPMQYNSITEKNPDNHPELAAADAKAVSDYLMALTSDVVEAGVIKPKKNPKGKLIFNKKMPCGGCHQYTSRKKVKGGMTGPTLIGAKKRLNPDWIYAYLKNPKVFKPVKMMPVFSGILSDKDMKSVSAYVANFK
jgi:mono/diheme cytochrome c family protein